MSGVKIIDTLATTGVGNYALVNNTDLGGGFQVVADSTARDAIRTGVRQAGMQVYSIYKYFPIRWFFNSTKDIKQSGFTCTAGAHNTD